MRADTHAGVGYTLHYNRKSRTYTDGKHLYMSATGIVKSFDGVGWGTIACMNRLGGPDLVVYHWGGAAGDGPAYLYRRDRVRSWFPYADYWQNGDDQRNDVEDRVAA